MAWTLQGEWRCLQKVPEPRRHGGEEKEEEVTWTKGALPAQWNQICQRTRPFRGGILSGIRCVPARLR